MARPSRRLVNVLPWIGCVDVSPTARAAFCVIEQLESRQLLSTTLFSDGFEGATLGAGWSTRADAGSNSSVRWGVNRAEHAGGVQAAFCAADGTSNSAMSNSSLS